jgi:cytochrome b involved in lipid metabolism
MMKKGVIIALVAVVVIVTAIILLSTGNNKENSQNLNYNDSPSDQQNQMQNDSQQQNNSPDQGTQPADKVTQTELALHNTQDDCWISYKKDVFDITSYLPKHPGSAAAITPYCGTSSDFESAFEGKHGTSQVEKLIREGTYKGELE